MPLTMEEIESLLKKTIRGATSTEIRRAALLIIEAQGKWKEVDLSESLGAIYSVQCKDICAIGKCHENGFKIRAFIAQE